jgi:membrane fusion protein (multidrug efflux system)
MKSKMTKGGASVSSENSPEVELVMINGETYPHKGKIAMVNNIINPTTGSVTLRADFNNPNFLLSSGSTGTIKVPSPQKDVMVVPKMATVDIQGNKLVYILQDDNTVKSQKINIIDQTDSEYLVSQGVQPGNTIVVEGVSKLREGQSINPIK